MKFGAVVGSKSATTVCPQVNAAIRNWIMFDIFIVDTFVDL
jgi:hypothetical protein